MTSTFVRIIFGLLLGVSVLNGWWLVALPLCALGVWFFPLYIECIIAGIVFDALFGLTPGIGLWAYVGTIGSVVVFGVVGFFKNKMR
ncbi:MAG: hypothetical protein AAB381_02230 [Patescibacteria group bacterium]